MATPQYVYVMNKLSKTYPGGKQVLKDVTLAFLPGAKIGVVGVNGAGKSTLLRIMAGEEKEFLGEAWAADGVSVGYLPQEPKLNETKDVTGNVMEALLTLMLSDRLGADVNAPAAPRNAAADAVRKQIQDDLGKRQTG